MKSLSVALVLAQLFTEASAQAITDAPIPMQNTSKNTTELQLHLRQKQAQRAEKPAAVASEEVGMSSIAEEGRPEEQLASRGKGVGNRATWAHDHSRDHRKGVHDVHGGHGGGLGAVDFDMVASDDNMGFSAGAHGKSLPQTDGGASVAGQPQIWHVSAAQRREERLKVFVTLAKLMAVIVGVAILLAFLLSISARMVVLKQGLKDALSSMSKAKSAGTEALLGEKADVASETVAAEAVDESPAESSRTNEADSCSRETTSIAAPDTPGHIAASSSYSSSSSSATQGPVSTEEVSCSVASTSSSQCRSAEESTPGHDGTVVQISKSADPAARRLASLCAKGGQNERITSGDASGAKKSWIVQLRPSLVGQPTCGVEHDCRSEHGRGAA